MKSKTITIIFSIMIIASLAYLATEEYLQTNSSESQTWWAAYFDDPKGESLDFFIENRGGSAEFHWEIYLEKNLIAQNSAVMETNQQKKIPITATDLSGRKVTIKIYKGEEKRELYKIIK